MYTFFLLVEPPIDPGEVVHSSELQVELPIAPHTR